MELTYISKVRWIPAASREEIQVGTTTGISFHIPKIGYAEFTVDGKKYKLTPVGVEESKLFFIFLDMTRHSYTDRVGRFLLIDLPKDGVKKSAQIILDFFFFFNEATIILRTLNIHKLSNGNPR